jgi:glycosyltransferase involved in cell wall biosynthesis
MQMLKVRHLLPGLGRVPRDLSNEGSSGLVRIAVELARAQVAHGDAVELYGWRPGASGASYNLLGINVHVTPGWRWARTTRVDARILAPLLVASAVGSVASIAHIHTEPHLLLAGRARARILHYHTPMPRPQPRAYRWLLRRAARVVCCSDFIRRQFLSQTDYPADRAVVVHGGINVDRFQDFSATVDSMKRQDWGIAADETAILYAGAIVPEKGVVELLEALHRLRAQQPDLRWRLLIAGDATLWRTIDAGPSGGPDPYTARAVELSRALPVTWLGVISEERMPALYAATDLVACPSVWDDPFPTVNVEAMAAGKPVVAARVGGVPEAVVDGTTGILVQPGRSDELASALAALIGDPDRRRALGEAARTRSKLFTSSAAAERLDALYREVLECA